MKKIIFIIAFLLVAFSCPVLSASRYSKGCAESSKDCFLKFIQEESSGSPDSRAIYAHLSKDDGFDFLISWEGSPFVLIDGYELSSEKTDDRGGYVYRVRYHVIGHTVGVGHDRVLHTDKPHYVEVEYHSQMIDGWWSVMDPPLPYVSLSFMRERYKNEPVTPPGKMDKNKKEILRSYF